MARWIRLTLFPFCMIGCMGSHQSDKPNAEKPVKEIENSIGMKLVLIPAGTFLMGSPPDEKHRVEGDEGPQHEVVITQPFYMGMHEVTQEQYEKVMGTNPSYFSPTGSGKDMVQGIDTRRFPVERVTWEEATEFCRKLSELPAEKAAGRLYRLPTEAQWEYACRGGHSTDKPFGIGDGMSLSSTQANFDGSEPYGDAKRGPHLRRPTTVGSYPPNAFGLHDMHGNVCEWCRDWFGPYSSVKQTDPENTTYSSNRAWRGGCWFSFGRTCRAASRYRAWPSEDNFILGFRVAQVPTVEPGK